MRKVLMILLTTLIACATKQERLVDKPFDARRTTVEINGEKTIHLTRERNSQSEKPQILEAVVLPGRGINIFQLKAYVPFKGIVDVFEAPPIAAAPALFNEANQADDLNGNLSFKYGGAILVPYANRIRGTLRPKSNTIETSINGIRTELPANWTGKRPGAERHAMHGLILNSKADEVTLDSSFERASATAVLKAGDFGDHWHSDTLLTITSNLTTAGFGLTVIAKNTGSQPMPIGIGWHPYFNIPSGNREQARLKIPGARRALVNNYDDVFPTGETEAVKGTAYDFTAPRALGSLYLDDCFLDLSRGPKNVAVAELHDPAFDYGVRVTALSPEISAFQVYAPPGQSFVALEPQTNLADPYNPAWKGRDTGMLVLQPGESITYAVEIEIFSLTP